MDLSKIDDVQQLKALAYDESQQVMIHQQNLQTIQQRLNQLASVQTEETPDDVDEAQA